MLPRTAAAIDYPIRAGAGALACLAAALVGCGNSRTTVPGASQPAKPTGFRALVYASAGIALNAPLNWPLSQQQAPLVSSFSSGSAVVAVWRFPRAAPVPLGPLEVRQASARLVQQARTRDPSIQIIRARPLTVQRAPAIEVDAIERVGGEARRVRSTHVFVSGAEVVLDEYAPPSVFHAVDHAVFSPVKRSLRLLARSASR